MRALQRVQHDDAGFSLVEMLVTLVLTGIVLAMVASFFLAVTKSTAMGRDSSSAVGSASNAADELGNMLGFAVPIAVAGSATPTPAISAASASSITFTALPDQAAASPVPVQITFSLDGSNHLVERRVTGVAASGTWGFSGTGTSVTYHGPFDTSSTPLLTYLTATGTTVDPGSGTLTAAQIATVTAVRVNLAVAKPSIPAANEVAVVRTIAMPNLLLNGSAS
jgi:prepilin-type N-terminal cleavage/methylation domain-containing protein